MSQMKAFIVGLIDFLDDLLLTFPEVLEIRTAYNQLTTWEDNASIKLTTAKSFMICCAPVFEAIFHENQEFFTDIHKLKEHDGFKTFGGETTTEQEENLMKMFELKDLWFELTEPTKKRIWRHLKTLLVKGAAALKKCDPNYNTKYDDILMFIRNNPELYK